MDKSKISIVISRSTLFLLVYSIVSFFIFYYNDPSSIFDTPDFYRSFDLILSNYIIFFLFFLIILVLVNISQSLKIQIFSSLIFFVISFILLTLFSGKYFIWVAVALTPYFIFLLLIFIMFYIPIFYLSKLFSDNQNVSTIISLFKKKYDMTVDTAWCWDLIERIGAFALIGWSEKMGDSWSIVQIARPEDLIVVKRKKMGASPMPMTREMLNGLSDKDEFEIIEIFELVD